MQPSIRRRLVARSPWVPTVVALFVAVLFGAALAAAEAPNAQPAPPVRRAAPVPIALRATQATPEASAGRGPGPTTQLVLIKVVRNEGGGAAVPSDWTLYATGARTERPTNLAGVSPVDSLEQWPDFKPDAYTLSETYTGSDPAAAARYVAAGWTCVDNQTGLPVEVAPAAAVGGKVVIVEGGDVTCTVVNVYSPPSPTPTPTSALTPTSSPTPPGGVRIAGKKLYRAWDGPFLGRLTGLSGWTITATLVGVENVSVTTTTGALGGWEFTEEALGPLAFSGATLRICEERRPGWRHLTPPCVTVSLPSPLPPGYTVVTPDFVNAQATLPAEHPDHK